MKVYVLYNDQKLVDDDKKQTRTVKNDLNPKFEEYFDFKARLDFIPLIVYLIFFFLGYKTKKTINKPLLTL